MNQNDLDEAHKLLAGEEGWGALDGARAKKQNYADSLKRYHHAERLAQAFGGATGAATLEALSEQFERPPTWPLQVTNQGDQQAYGYIREGQKSVVTAIRNAIAIVKAGPPAQPNSTKAQETVPQ